jgi:hypothetical protein
MDRDASLDDFYSETESSTADTKDAPESESTAPPESPKPTEHEPPHAQTDAPTRECDDDDRRIATAAWTPEPTPCAMCHEPVSRRWQEAGQLVCTDCKSWRP